MEKKSVSLSYEISKSSIYVSYSTCQKLKNTFFRSYNFSDKGWKFLSISILYQEIPRSWMGGFWNVFPPVEWFRAVQKPLFPYPFLCLSSVFLLLYYHHSITSIPFFPRPGRGDFEMSPHLWSGSGLYKTSLFPSPFLYLSSVFWALYYHSSISLFSFFSSAFIFLPLCEVKLRWMDHL